MKSFKTYLSTLSFILAMLSMDETFSQGISAHVDRDKIRIGEKILLTLKAEDVKPETISQWFIFPDTINHFEVVERGKVDTLKVDGMVSYQQVLYITSFDSGRWEIPVLKLQVGPSVMSTQSIIIDVLPVDVSQLKDYHDIKEIVEVKDEKSKLITILLIIVTLIALAIIIWLLRKKRKMVEKPMVPEDSRQPLEWALSELNKLQQEDLPARGLVKQFYQRMTDISRQYFHRQLSQSALHQTTDEWMFSLQDLQVGTQTKTSFFQFLRLADTVKFAKYQPPHEENNTSITAASAMFKIVAEYKSARSTPRL